MFNMRPFKEYLEAHQAASNYEAEIGRTLTPQEFMAFIDSYFENH